MRAKLLILIPFAFIFIPQILFGQSVLVHGKVMDQNSEPLIGVTVFVEGTLSGAFSDVDGSFSITANIGDNLRFTYIGYVGQSVTIRDQSFINIIMNEDLVQLEGVVVVGYGVQRKESVVGSIAQATGDDVKRSTSSSNLINSLSGLIPGVQTLQTSGQPGDNSTLVLIRGQSTWNSSAPLILIDGVERNINDINPNEVETISVLKDASATAVFGVKGGNGVILITTKQGKEGKPRLSFDIESSLNFLSRLPETVNTYEGIKNRNYAIIHESGVNPTIWGRYVSDEVLEYYRTQEHPQFYQDFDWREKMLKDFALATKVNMDISGGTKFVKYFSSLGYYNEGGLPQAEDVGQGYVPDFKYSRLNFRTNLDFQITPSTLFSVRNSGYRGVQKTPPGGTEIFVGLIEKPGDDPIFQYDDGTYGGSLIPYSHIMNANPFVYMNFRGYNTNSRFQINNDLILQQKLDMITEGLSLRASLSYDNNFNTSGPNIDDAGPATKYVDPAYLEAGPGANIEDYTTYFYPERHRGDHNFEYHRLPISQNTESVSTGSVGRQLYYQFSINYNRDFGKHNVGGLGLMSRQESTRGSNFTNYREDWVGRMTYDYNRIYLFEVNWAYNGSEKFAGSRQIEEGIATRNYRYGFFPSIGAGIVLSNLDFFQRKLPAINTLKLRYSNGIVGVDAAPPAWQYIASWNISNTYNYFVSPDGVEVRSAYPWRTEGIVPNPDLHWEEVKKENIALEVGVLQNLFSLNVDVFREHRTGIFITSGNRLVPFYLGISEPPSGNLGETKSQGMEIEFKISKRMTGGLHLFSNLSFTRYIDQIIKREDPELLPDYQKQAGYSIGQFRSIINDRIIQNWDEIYTGVLSSDPNILRNTLPGDFRHIDFNADGFIFSTDGAPIGFTGRPQNTYSLQLGAKYKGFELFAHIYGVFNITRSLGLNALRDNAPIVYTHRLLDSYSPELGVTEDAQFHHLRYNWSLQTFGGYSGNANHYDASYLRLRSAELSYTLNPKLAQKIRLENVRVFARGSNLLFWSKLVEDRETGGWERNNFPLSRSVVFGTRFTF